MNMKNLVLTSIIKLKALIIFHKTLFFKFSAADENIFIFSASGIDPYGRIGSEIVELITSVLILIHRTTLIRALIGLGTMAVAMLSHFLVLGIVLQNNHGTLFISAVIAFLCSATLIYQNRVKVSQSINI